MKKLAEKINKRIVGARLYYSGYSALSGSCGNQNNQDIDICCTSTLDLYTLLGIVVGIIGGIPGIFYLLHKYKKQKISWSQILKHVTKIANMLKNDKWQPDLFLAFPKGGLIVSDLLGHHFNNQVDIAAIHTKRELNEYKEIVLYIRHPYAKLGSLKGKRILIVDDVLENGNTLVGVIKLLVDSGVKRDDIKSAILGKSDGVDPAITPDYYAFKYTKSRGLFLPWGPVTL